MGLRKALIRLAAATVVGLVVIGVYGAFRIWSQGMQDERRPAGAVVVLGAAQYNGRPSPIYQARLQHAVDLFKTGQHADQWELDLCEQPAGAPLVEVDIERAREIEHGHAVESCGIARHDLRSSWGARARGGR